MQLTFVSFSFLARYLQQNPGEVGVKAAVERYVRFVLKHGTGEYGVEDIVNTSGFVGLALIDVLKYGGSF